MPRTKTSSTTIYTSLVQDECARFDAICRAKGLSRSVAAREALRFFIEHQDQIVSEAKNNKLELRLKRMEDRIAALLARTAIDVGIVYTLIWRNLPKDTREDQLRSAYTQAVNRLKTKMSGDSQVTELIKDDQRSS